MSSPKLDNGDISVSQSAYMEKMLGIPGISYANGVPTPYAATQTPKDDDD